MRQWPVGLFDGKVAEGHEIFTRGKSAIDLIGIRNDTLILFELKKARNRKVWERSKRCPPRGAWSRPLQACGGDCGPGPRPASCPGVESPSPSKLSIQGEAGMEGYAARLDRKSTRLNSSHLGISYAVFCLKKK